MNSAVGTNARGVGSWITPPRATALVLIAVAYLYFLAGFGLNTWFIAYMTLVVVSFGVVRGIRDEPGRVLRRRVVRRSLVIAIAAVCMALVVTSGSTGASGAGLVIMLIVLDMALGTATQRLATAGDAIVDERQESLRNRAHLIAYWLFATLIGILVVAQLSTTDVRTWVEKTLFKDGWIVLFQLMFVLPAMTLAWLHPDHVEADEVTHHRLSRRAIVGLGLVVVTVAIPFLLSAYALVGPLRSTASIGPAFTAAVSRPGSLPWRCREFQARTTVGVVIEAQLPLHAVICWDGRKAFEVWGLNSSDCEQASSVMANVQTVACTRSVSPDGTLSFRYQADVGPVFLPFTRDARLEVSVDRNGNVVRFP